MELIENYYIKNDYKIHEIKWIPEGKPKAILQIVHGITEYIYRYNDFANYLASQGILVCGVDLRGHGKTKKLENNVSMYLGETGSWFEITKELNEYYENMKSNFPDIPYYMLGFSMGSFLLRTLLVMYPKSLDGAIIMGTGYQGKIALKLAEFMAKTEEKAHGYNATTAKIDELTFGLYNKKIKNPESKFDWLCENKEELNKYLKDPERGDSMTVGLFSEMLSGMEFSCDKKNIDKMDKNKKILLLSGISDPVGNYSKGVKTYYQKLQKANFKNVKIKFVEGRHDILHEKSKPEVYETIMNWIIEK